MKSPTDAVTNIVRELVDFPSEERRRIVQASLTLLGETLAGLSREIAEVKPTDGALPLKAKHWLKQHNLTSDQVDQVFHLSDGNAQIIAAIPGNTKKEQVRNAYVLCGIGRLLVDGESKFDDAAARKICEQGGFFDGSNHMKYMKAREFTGSRERGWVLTSPGLRLGAALINQLSSQ